MERPESDLNAFEARLASWQPASPGADRDRVMFLAGKAAGRAELRHRLLTGSAACVALVIVSLGGLLAREHSRRILAEIRVAEAQLPSPSVYPQVQPSPIGQPASTSYLVLSHQPPDLGTARERLSLPSDGASQPQDSMPLRVRDRSRFSEL